MVGNKQGSPLMQDFVLQYRLPFEALFVSPTGYHRLLGGHQLGSELFDKLR